MAGLARRWHPRQAKQKPEVVPDLPRNSVGPIYDPACPLVRPRRGDEMSLNAFSRGQALLERRGEALAQALEALKEG